MILTMAALVVAVSGGPGIARQFGRWAAATTLWSVIALSLVAPNLVVIAAGLPNDEYHAWLDSILLAVIGVAVSRLWTATATRVGRAAAIAIVVACLVLSLPSMPPLSSSDGGWPEATEAAARIRSVTGDQPTAVTGVFKSGAALTFPLQRQGSPIVELSAAEFLVVTCDPLFEVAVGTPCDGWAELPRMRQTAFPATRVAGRFVDSSRRTVVIFCGGLNIWIPAVRHARS